jgi:hypothetical protein
MIAVGHFTIDSRVETPLDQHDGTLLRSVVIAKHFWGDIDGSSSVQMLGYKTAVAGSESYVAFERMSVSIGGRQGEFVLRHSAMRSTSVSEGGLKVVVDSGTGELRGISGEGSIEFHPDRTATFTFDYEL